MEDFNVSLSNPVGGASLGTPRTVDVKIIDDEVLSFGTGALRLGKASYNVLESQGEAVITVERVGGAHGVVTVHYSTSNGRAKAEFDYVETAGTLTFLDGESMKTISIPIVEDDVNDPGESFNITISNPTNGATLMAPETATVDIQ